jgi:aminoglycoside phosphotransferase
MMKYTFSKHAKSMIQERKIRLEWIHHTLDMPDFIETRSDGNQHYFKKIIDFGSRYLHIVINDSVNPNKIVTLFFDRGVKEENR